MDYIVLLFIAELNFIYLKKNYSDNLFGLMMIGFVGRNIAANKIFFGIISTSF